MMTVRHACSKCSLSFTRRHNLKAHELTHTEERPYQCSVCEHRFRRAHDLKRHARAHSGERPFTCNVCQRSFSRADALVRHSHAHCLKFVKVDKRSSSARKLYEDPESGTRINLENDINVDTLVNGALSVENNVDSSTSASIETGRDGKKGSVNVDLDNNVNVSSSFSNNYGKAFEKLNQDPNPEITTNVNNDVNVDTQINVDTPQDNDTNEINVENEVNVENQITVENQINVEAPSSDSSGMVQIDKKKLAEMMSHILKLEIRVKALEEQCGNHQKNIALLLDLLKDKDHKVAS